MYDEGADDEVFGAHRRRDAAAAHASTHASRLPRPPSALRQGARTNAAATHQQQHGRPHSHTKGGRASPDLAATGGGERERTAPKKVIDYDVDLIALHDDLMRTKKQVAKAEEEKHQLNNRLMRLEQALRKKDREIDEVLVKGAQAAAGDSCASTFLYMKSERSMLDAMRKRAVDLERALSERDLELATLRASTKVSNVSELQTQSATYLGEARRLRLLLQQSREQLQHQMQSCQSQHSGNFQLLQARVDSLQTENERLSAQLASAVETAELLVVNNQALSAECEARAARQEALERASSAQQKKLAEQQQQLVVARDAAAKAAAAAHAAAGAAQQFARQHMQTGSPFASPTPKSPPVYAPNSTSVAARPTSPNQ